MDDGGVTQHNQRIQNLQQGMRQARETVQMSWWMAARMPAPSLLQEMQPLTCCHATMHNVLSRRDCHGAQLPTRPPRYHSNAFTPNLCHPTPHPSTHLFQKQPQQPQAESPEAIPLQQLKQVDAQLLKSQAQVALMHKGVMQAHNMVLIVGVQAAVEQLQDANLYARLLVVGILVLDDLWKKGSGRRCQG